MPDYTHKYLHVEKCGRKFFVHIVFLLYQALTFLQGFLYRACTGGIALLLLDVLNDHKIASVLLIQHKSF